MKFNKGKYFSAILFILLLLGVGYYFRDNVSFLWRNLSHQLRPCEQPITYSIANLDPQFGLTQAKFLEDIKKAEKIWESAIGKPLFEYSPTGDLKIKLIYDYRQKATDALKKIGIVIHDDKATYNTVKAKYDSLVAEYNKEKTSLTSLIENYNQAKSALEKDISYWNNHGGAPKSEYDALQQRKTDLNNQAAFINQTSDSLNKLVDTVNSTVVVLNKLITGLNLQANKYNTIGAPINKEFSEGEYVSDANGTAINIYQFNDENNLVRVLAHELGHALGLEHLNNPKAIMYYLNEGMNEELTADDIAALKKVCGIK